MSNSTLPHEIWKPIPEYEGMYEISSLGRVKSIDRLDSIGRRLPGRILRPRQRSKGYLSVDLYRDGIPTTYSVHRLVLLAFVGSPPPGTIACHANDVRDDNRLSNLRWGTPRENNLDAVDNGRHYNVAKDRCPRGHLLAEPNLVASEARRGWRKCLACARARARTHRRPALRDQFKDLSDSYYLQIMRAG